MVYKRESTIIMLHKFEEYICIILLNGLQKKIKNIFECKWTTQLGQIHYRLCLHQLNYRKILSRENILKLFGLSSRNY